MIRLSMHKPGVLRIDAGPRDVSRLKTVPGIRADATADPPHWTCAATLYHGVVLRNVFGEELEYDDAVRAHMTALRREERRQRTYVLENGDPRLFGYQRRGAGRLSLPGGAMLADEVGTGKTVQALQALRACGAEALPAIVVTTRSMKLRWAAEAAEWFPEAVPYPVVGSAAERKKVLAAAAQDPKALVTINWEALRNHTRLAHYPGVALTDKDQQLKELNAIEFRTVIADEAHRMKDPKTKQSRAVWWLGKTATRRWTLTGTPLGNEYVDLWSQFHFIDPQVWTSRSAFLDRYVVSVFNGFTEEPLFLRPENKDELFWWVDNHMLRRTIAELPELASEVPTVREMRLDLELTPKQASLYKKLKKEMMATIDGELLAATDPLVLAGKLNFVASAMPVLQDGEVVGLEEPSNKITALLELLEDRELRPAVVFAESRKLVELAAAVCRKEGYNVGVISGAQNDQQRNAYVSQFQAGELDVLLSTAAGGEGITLTAGASMIFLRTPSSLIMYKQMLGRVPRIGNKRSVIPAYHLVSTRTTDEIAFDLIVSKAAKAEDILRDKTRILGTL